MSGQREREDPVDALIVTAVKDELDAALAVDTGAVPGGLWKRHPEAVGPEAFYRSFTTDDGDLCIGVVQSFGMGREQAAIAATTVLDRHPEIRCLAMCGVCAGRRGEVALGDVIIADRTWPYDAGKVKITVEDQGHRTERFLGDMELYRIQPAAWKQRAEQFPIDPMTPWIKERPYSYEEQGDWVMERLVKNKDPTTHPDRKMKCPDWEPVLKQLWKVKRLEAGELRLTDTGRRYINHRLMLEPDGRREPGPFKTVVGPIATGALVVEDPTIFERLSDTQAMRKVVGLEMETSAILGLAHQRSVPYAVVMKGVMDHADAFKSDNMKRFAAKASAECLVAFLRQNLPVAKRTSRITHDEDRSRVDSKRVFISYTHDSDEHRKRVLKLADRLCIDGIDTWIDRYFATPPEGWVRWREHQLEIARNVILVCTEAYQQRFHELHGKLDPEHHLIPVIFSAKEKAYIPLQLADSAYYCLEADYARLQRKLPTSSEIPLTRHEQSVGEQPQAQSSTVSSASEKVAKTAKKVLIVAANREGDPPLALGREIREITTALRSASSTRFEVHILWAATDRDLRRAVLGVKPHILHFCGHGTGAGPILEHTEHGNEARDGEVLRNWLKVALKGISLDLALLNFCDSHDMLDSFFKNETALVVIGPIQRIVDEHAIAFSAAFYMALAAGGTASFSYHLARSAVEMSPSVAEIAKFASVRDYSIAPEEGPQSGPYGIRSRIADAMPSFVRKPRSHRRTFVFFASEPDGLDRLRLDRTLREIRKVFPSQAPFRFEQRWATRSLDLLYTLLNAYPALVHIAGHGTSAGAFLFEHDRYRNGVAAPSHALARVLRAFHQYIECVVLMFSNSYLVARELEYMVDCVVGVDGILPSGASNMFSDAFYEMIDDGNSYRNAFDAGIAVLPSSLDRKIFYLHGRNLDKRIAEAVRQSKGRASSPTSGRARNRDRRW